MITEQQMNLQLQKKMISKWLPDSRLSFGWDASRFGLVVIKGIRLVYSGKQRDLS